MSAITQLNPAALPGSPYGSFDHTRAALTNVWIGGAPTIAQIQGYTFGGVWLANEHVYFLIVDPNGNVRKRFTVPVGTTAISNILTLLVAAFGGLDSTEWPEFAEVTAGSQSGTVFTLTADTAGNPFSVTLQTDSANGTIDGGAFSTGYPITANSGPEDYACPANWSTSTVPITGDTIIADLDGATIKWNLDQSSVSPAEVRILFPTGSLGLPQTNANGYPEYRQRYLKFATATLVNVQSTRSNFINVHCGTGDSTVNVTASGTTGQGGTVPSVLILGSNVTASVTKGFVGFAALAGETCTLALTIGQSTNANDANVVLGAGCVLSTVVKMSGTLTCNCAVGTSLTQAAGTTTINGTGNVAQLTIDGGKVILNTAGTLGGNTVVAGSGYLDFSQDARTGKVVTNPIVLYGAQAGGSDALGVIARPYTVASKNGLGFINFNFGPSYQVAVSNAA